MLSICPSKNCQTTSTVYWEVPWTSSKCDWWNLYFSPLSAIPKKRLVVLEVYAGETSPITESLRALGVDAYRFTKRDGDLSTPAGRRTFWSLIDTIEPDHIFVAPECGFWSGWNRFNAQRSLRLWDHVHARQAAERVHIQLCAQLCTYQTKRNIPSTYHHTSTLGGGVGLGKKRVGSTSHTRCLTSL